jgi:alpha-beta hydrolase superfamily lysophospholipase
MSSVLYFHGFASSPLSTKVQSVSGLLEPEGIVLNVPDLNVPSFERLDWNAMIDRAVDAGRRDPPVAIAGSSLGGLVALAVMQRGIVAPLILIAPAIGIADRWRTELPTGDPIVVWNHAREANVPIHRAFFEQMAEVHVDDDAPPAPVTVIMGGEDESVPFDRVERTWRRWEASGRLMDGSQFIEILAGNHGLTEHVDVIALSIIEAVKGCQ